MSVEQAAAAPPPLREEQVQNAVAFLTHAQVQHSPASTKRSFLEKKGLTPQEIDEAFVRAGQSQAAEPTAVSSTQVPGLVTYVPKTQPTISHAPQQQQLAVMQPQQIMAQPRPEPVRWTQVHALQ